MNAPRSTEFTASKTNTREGTTLSSEKRSQTDKTESQSLTQNFFQRLTMTIESTHRN